MELSAEQYDVLRQELQAERYNGLTAEQAYTDMRTKRFPGPYPSTFVTLTRDVGVQIARRLISSLRTAAATDVLLDEILQGLRNGQAVDINSQHTRSMLDAFAANETLPLTRDDAAVITALADNRIDRATQLNLGALQLRHVSWVMMGVR